MKLSAISPVILNNLKLNSVSKQKIQNNSASTNAILKNSLQEAIGRSQVSFNGTGRITKEGFEYEHSRGFGILSEDIKYNKETGELQYQEYAPSGQVLKHVRFIPAEQTSVVTTYDDDNTTTRTVTSPQGTIIETKDELGKQIYFEYEKPNHQKKAVETDYDRNRQVITLSAPNVAPKVKVLDMNTNQYVVSGPLVEDRIEVEDGVFETTNIVTGAIYKREVFANRGKYLKITDFSRETGIRVRETEIEKGETSVTNFDEKGIKKDSITTDKKGAKIFITYNQDGINIASKIKKVYDSQNRVIEQINYFPNTDDTIQNVIKIDRVNKTKTIICYNVMPNVPLNSEKYENGEVVEYIDFYDNGRSPKRIVTYSADRSYVKELFEESGRKPKTQANYYDKENTLCKIEKYSTQTGKMYESREAHPSQAGMYIIKHFDEYSGKLTTKDLMTHTNTIMEKTYYWDNGHTPRKFIKFNSDRSYTITKYDENHKIISVKEFNADKTPKA